MDYIANFEISKEKIEKARIILKRVHEKTKEGILNGKGPFYAEIYDENGNFICGESNSVIADQCSSNHAEMNAIRKACEYYHSYDLGSKNLTVYVNAEPCVMCMGALMWSGIKTVFYSVPSKTVEEITGFDEGFKPSWHEEFKKRNINVCGGLEQDLGKEILNFYMQSGQVVYKPNR